MPCLEISSGIWNSYPNTGCMLYFCLFEIDKPCIFILWTGRYALENGAIFYFIYFFAVVLLRIQPRSRLNKMWREKKKKGNLFPKDYYYFFFVRRPMTLPIHFVITKFHGNYVVSLSKGFLWSQNTDTKTFLLGSWLSFNICKILHIIFKNMFC